jgi:hypothetical protein
VHRHATQRHAIAKPACAQYHDALAIREAVRMIGSKSMVPPPPANGWFDGPTYYPSLFRLSILNARGSAWLEISGFLDRQPT